MEIFAAEESQLAAVKARESRLLQQARKAGIQLAEAERRTPSRISQKSRVVPPMESFVKVRARIKQERAALESRFLMLSRGLFSDARKIQADIKSAGTDLTKRDVY